MLGVGRGCLGVGVGVGCWAGCVLGVGCLVWEQLFWVHKRCICFVFFLFLFFLLIILKWTLQRS
jgi:hypothetical protein